MLIDLTEIPSAGGAAFEAFTYQFLLALGYQTEVQPSEGIDGGRDMVVRDPGFLQARRGMRWLVSCKHTRARVGMSDDAADRLKLERFNCNGFMLFYSAGWTSSLQMTYEDLRSRTGYEYQFYGPLEIENAILSDFLRFAPLVRQFLPLSFEKLTGLTSEMEKRCCEAFNEAHDDRYLMIYQAGLRFAATPCCENCMSNLAASLEHSGLPYRQVHMSKALTHTRTPRWS